MLKFLKTILFTSLLSMSKGHYFPIIQNGSNNLTYLHIQNQIKKLNVNEYGQYCLEEDGHNINDYFKTMRVQLKNTNTFTFLAPALTYKNESNRYIEDEVENTITQEITHENTYDLWDEAYNTQPYGSSSPVTIEGYYGDTFIRNMSFSISGNKKDFEHYYYKDMSFTLADYRDDINNVRFKIKDYHYSEDVLLSTTTENRTIHQEADTKAEPIPLIKSESTRFRRGMNYSFTKEIELDPGYSVTSASVEVVEPSILSQFGNLEITNNGSNATIKATFQASANMSSSCHFNFLVTMTRSAGDILVPFNITAPSEPKISSNEVGEIITLDTQVDWFGKYFLETINCSGQGDNTDKALVTSRWNTVENYFASLPTLNKERIINGDTSIDGYLEDALLRYDYCLFFKNYPLNDFLGRKNKASRYYQNNSRLTIMNDQNITIILIAISSLVSLGGVSLLIYLLNKKKTNQ